VRESGIGIGKWVMDQLGGRDVREILMSDFEQIMLFNLLVCDYIQALRNNMHCTMITLE